MLSPSARAADPLADLTRLLNRLQQTVLRADAERERRLRASEYERRRVETVSTSCRHLEHLVCPGTVVANLRNYEEYNVRSVAASEDRPGRLGS